MKSYTKGKGKKGKFEKAKLNKKMGIITITKSSKLETKNANRSLKKGFRQESKQEIIEEKDLDIFEIPDEDDNYYVY